MPLESPHRKEMRLVFGEVAELYDRARPNYPAALIDHLVLAAGGGGPVLDVGCGTGKATVLLAGRGLDGVGLEPDLEMARVARRNLVPFPTWSVASGDFEDYNPTPDAPAKPGPPGSTRNNEGPFALITCAQAWHWLDPERRFHKAASLLRRGGVLALFWNRTADDPSPVRREIDAVYADLFPALSPHGTLTAGRPPVGTPPVRSRPDGSGDHDGGGDHDRHGNTGAGFGPASWQVFPWVRRYTTREWTDQVQTHSDHRMLEPRGREILVARLSQVIDAHGGSFDHPYDCWLWTAARA